MICIKSGRIHTGVDREAFVGDILIRDSKILDIGPELGQAVPDAQIYDAQGLDIYPGFIDAHCHVGLSVAGAAAAGKDVNEGNDPVTPQLRAIDGINPFDENLRRAAQAGVTCVATGPGSANCIGGTFAVIKTWGKRVDDMVVKEEAAMKCAFGENPKTFYQSKSVSSRMTNAAMIRTAIKKAKLYEKKLELAAGDYSKYPAYDEKCEALLPVLRKEIPFKAHAHQANDIFTALRIAREFDLDITLEHVTEGHLIVEELAKEQVPLAVGPTFCSVSKYECRNISWETAGALSNAGCHVAIITDAPVVPLEHLPLYAGFAVKAGMDEYQGLRAITICAAEHMGVADRVGSLEKGKDADIVVISGSPFTGEGTVRYVFINGRQIRGQKEIIW